MYKVNYLGRGVILLGWILLTSHGYAQTSDQAAHDCPEAMSMEQAGLIDLLGQPRQNLRATCVIAAIHRLGETRSPKAAQILTRYLDFERKLPDTHGRPELVLRIRWLLGEKYPALEALLLIGDSALPAIVDAIGNHCCPAITRTESAG